MGLSAPSLCAFFIEGKNFLSKLSLKTCKTRGILRNFFIFQALRGFQQLISQKIVKIV